MILNAVQASSINAVISINAKKKNKEIMVEIIDQGSGIEGNDFSKIFDPFFTTKSEGEGTGLGLSVSYGIIKHHSGNISIENEEGAGVKVSISLPVKSNIKNKELDYLEARDVG